MWRYNGIEKIENKQVREQIDELAPGCFVLAYELPNGNIEALAMHKFDKATSTMIPKENLFSLHYRYLNKEERALAKPTLDQEQN